MEWSDEGIVLSARRHGETAAILCALSAQHGRHAGLVHGGAGRRARGALQPGNRVRLTWKARLAEQLGTFSWEAAEPFGTRWLDDPGRLAGIASACALIEALMPERQPYPESYRALVALLTGIGDDRWAGAYVHWELGLLADLGFGLDLSRCAVTGATEGLAFVSPRSGAAVTYNAGVPYRDRLLALPAFLIGEGAAGAADVVAGLALTGYFLERHLLGPHGKTLPAARVRFVAHLHHQDHHHGN